MNQVGNSKLAIAFERESTMHPSLNFQAATHIVSRVLEAVNLRAASTASTSALPLPSKGSYFTSSYPTHLFGSGCYKPPLPLPKP